LSSFWREGLEKEGEKEGEPKISIGKGGQDTRILLKIIEKEEKRKDLHPRNSLIWKSATSIFSFSFFLSLFLLWKFSFLAPVGVIGGV